MQSRRHSVFRNQVCLLESITLAQLTNVKLYIRQRHQPSNGVISTQGRRQHLFRKLGLEDVGTSAIARNAIMRNAIAGTLTRICSVRSEAVTIFEVRVDS